MLVQLLEDETLTRERRVNARFRSGQQLSSIDLVIHQHENDVQSLSCHSLLGKTRHVTSTSTFRPRQENVRKTILKNFVKLDLKGWKQAQVYWTGSLVLKRKLFNWPGRWSSKTSTSSKMRFSHWRMESKRAEGNRVPPWWGCQWKIQWDAGEIMDPHRPKSNGGSIQFTETRWYKNQPGGSSRLTCRRGLKVNPINFSICATKGDNYNCLRDAHFKWRCRSVWRQ